MKKIKTSFIVLSALVAAIALSSCSNNTPEVKKHVAEVVDLRNKKGDEISFRSAARDIGDDFSFEFLKTVPRFIGENGVETNHPSFLDIKDVNRYNPNDEEFNKILDAVKIEDHKDGVKFTFKRMAGFVDEPYTWVNVQFLDDVGHKSTGISFSPENKPSFVNEEGTVEIIYPLVDPTRPNKYGKETRFWIQLTTEKYYADLSYKVVPKNGHGCVENVQEDYNIRDYLKLSEDGIMSLELTIPPIAKADTLKHNVGIYVQETSDPQYTKKAGNPVNTKLGIFNEAASEAEINAANEGKVVEYKVDLKEFYEELNEDQKNSLNTLLKDNPYVWVSLTYNYKVDIPGLEDYVFDTPWVISNVISNPFAAE